ncbi:MAG: serine/threonine-protein kinase, partial [Candidatus Eremiobacterota bacterium]
MALRPGQILGDRYRITRVLSSGGMGAVYVAEDTRLDYAVCAVKEMLEQHLGTGDEEVIFRRFEQEKAMLARLRHPGIPRFLDFFLLEGLCYLVIEFVRGANLEQELTDLLDLTGKPFPPEELVRAILQVLEVLEYLHGQDPPVVHRDVKPANVIREFRTGRIMLVDFGLARPVQVGRAQTSVGTLRYTAIEQIQGRAEPRSDLYSLGASMHQLLSGQEPVPLGMAPLRSLQPDVDEELAAVVDRACSFAAEARFPDARSMRAALEAWLERPATPTRAPLHLKPAQPDASPP